MPVPIIWAQMYTTSWVRWSVWRRSSCTLIHLRTLPPNFSSWRWGPQQGAAEKRRGRTVRILGPIPIVPSAIACRLDLPRSAGVGVKCIGADGHRDGWKQAPSFAQIGDDVRDEPFEIRVTRKLRLPEITIDRI